METATARTKDRAHAVDVLRRLNDIGAINLDVMIAKADEIKALSGGGGSAASELEPEDRICYRFYIKFGPRLDVDIVSVASELKALGFEVTRTATQ